MDSKGQKDEPQGSKSPGSKSPRGRSPGPKAPPDNPPFAKKHISAALKHMPDDESKGKALEAMVKFKKLFNDKKFGPVMEKLNAFAQEDPLRVEEKGKAPVTPAERPRPPPISTASRERAMSTPRERWDVVATGQITPLSPTPTGNAFGGGGYWENLTPTTEKSPATATPPVKTPTVEAPASPIIPTIEPAASIYKQVKSDVDSLARALCNARLSVSTGYSGGSAQLPASVIRPRDTLRAAELTLEYLRVDLTPLVESKMPEKLQSCAEEEKKITDEFTIRSPSELANVDTWLHIDEPTMQFNTIFDTQRDLVRMLRERRKAALLDISDAGLKLAWATRIYEDAERAVEADGDDCADLWGGAADEGYEYNNFLRSIRREVSAAESEELTTLVEELEIEDERRRVDKAAASVRLSRETFASAKTSASPRGSAPTSLSRGKREGSGSPEKSLGGRSSDARGRLSIAAPSIKEVDENIPSPEASPVEKAFRRKGANPSDLDNWAEEIKKMSEKQKGKMKAEDVHPALTSGEYDADDEETTDEEFYDAKSVQDDASINNADYRDENVGSEVVSKENERPARSSFAEKYGYKYHTGMIPLPPSSSSIGTSSSSHIRSSPSKARYPAFGAAPPSNTGPSASAFAASSSTSKDLMTLQSASGHPARRRSMAASFVDLSLEDDEDGESGGVGVEEAERWAGELARMESREQERQARERMD